MAGERYSFAQVVALHDMLASGRVGDWWISGMTHHNGEGRGPGYEVNLCLGPCVQQLTLSEYQDIEQVVQQIERRSGGDGG